MKPDTNHLPAIAIKPIIMPLVAMILGFVVWVIDAVIDVYVLAEEQTLISNIIAPDDASELWMRILVVVVFIIMGMFSRHILLKHIELDRVLLDYQKKLEGVVEQRTRDLVIKTEELELLATTDPLTGLINRRKFTEILNKEIWRFERYGQGFCVMLIDIDKFKTINDQHGHDIGDEVIVQVARELKENVRRSDTVCRWGGEEFILLNVEVDEQQAMRIAENIRQAVKISKNDVAGGVTVSIGVCLVNKSITAKDMIKLADEALYQAKNSGRDCVVCGGQTNQAA